MDAENLRRYLEYYQDIGIKEIYKQAASPQAAEPAPTPAVAAPVIGAPAAPPIKRMAEMPAPPPLSPPGETLLQILEDIGDCTRCKLHSGRNKLVFGVGAERAPLVFVGEGPGADEDAQGIPFVGRAGQLLTQMIEGTAKKEGIDILRKDVYICNVVKCRPPEIRTPEPGEMATCGGFLYRQLTVLGR